MNATLRRCAVVTALVLWLLAGIAPAAPKNVILMIGDGMGPGHLKAASLFAYGKEGRLFLEQLPAQGTCTTDVVEPPLGIPSGPDSAATGTALATGVKVYRGTISVRLPGDGEDLPTLLETLAKQGKRTGLVTTVGMADATPAVFAAHAKNRKLYAKIYEDYFTRTRPNLIFGGASRMPAGAPQQAGYQLVASRDELRRAEAKPPRFICGAFCRASFPYEWDYAHRIDARYDYLPHLSEMARAAVKILAAEKRGFFLMIEGGQIDHAAHVNHLPKTVMEVLEFDNAVKEVFRWAEGRDDTLVVITADHETGGLKVATPPPPPLPAGLAEDEEPPKMDTAGVWPEATWATWKHTTAPVPIFAWGVGAEQFAGELDDTDVPKRILPLPESDEDVDQKIFQKLSAGY